MRAYSRPALVPATLAAPAHPPSAAGCNGLANAEDTVSTRPQQQHTPGGHLQATVSDCHRLKVRYVSRNSPCADGRPSLPSAGAAFDARPCGQGQTMLSNTHNTATSMVSVRAHRAAPYSLRRHGVGWSAVVMLLRRRTKVCLRGARGVCDDTKKCWECCPAAQQSLWLMPCRSPGNHLLDHHVYGPAVMKDGLNWSAAGALRL